MVPSHSYQFASALVVQHPAGGVIGFFLGVMETGGLIRVVPFISPFSIRATKYGSISTFAHYFFVAFRKTEDLGREPSHNVCEGC
jgi:hypothetical protein